MFSEIVVSQSVNSMEDRETESLDAYLSSSSSKYFERISSKNLTPRTNDVHAKNWLELNYAFSTKYSDLERAWDSFLAPPSDLASAKLNTDRHFDVFCEIHNVIESSLGYVNSTPGKGWSEGNAIYPAFFPSWFLPFQVMDQIIKGDLDQAEFHKYERYDYSLTEFYRTLTGIFERGKVTSRRQLTFEEQQKINSDPHLEISLVFTNPDTKQFIATLAYAFHLVFDTPLPRDILTKTSELIEPDLLIPFFKDIINNPPDRHSVVLSSYVTTFLIKLNYSYSDKIQRKPPLAITNSQNSTTRTSNSIELLEDSESESDDTIERMPLTHYDKKITPAESSGDSNQNTDSTTDLKNSTIKTETTTEPSSTLTQSSSSNLQESSNNIMISMPRKLISSHFTFSFEDLEHLQCNCGGCNNALNTEVSTSEEKNDDRQVFALSRMLLQAEESFNNDPKSLLRNRGKCNNALNTEASSEENSSVGNSRVFLIYDSIIYPEERFKKGSMKKLPIRESTQNLEKDD
jgi:hypothetical protein